MTWRKDILEKLMISGRKSLICLAVLGMELCWLYALLTAVNNSAADKISVPLLLTVFLLSWGSSSLLRYWHLPKPLITGLSWLIWPVVLLIMIKIQLFPATDIADTAWLLAAPRAVAAIFSAFEPALFILLSSIALWWLGRRVAYIQRNFSTFVAEFQFGLVLLLIAFFSDYMLNLDQSASLSVAMAFFSLSLVGISLSNTQDDSRLNSWRQGPWSGLLLGTIGLVLLLGLIISFILTPGLIHLFLAALGWVWGLIERAISFFAGLFPHAGPQTPPPLPAIPAPTPGDTGGFHFSWPHWLTSGMKTVWIIIVVGLLIAALWQITSQISGWVRRRVFSAGGEREPLKGAFKTDFLSWISRLISTIFRLKFKFGYGGTKAPAPAETASVRQLYRQFLHWAAKNGYPRLETQTPQEYQKALEMAISGNGEELDFLTREYMNARYGHALPSHEDLNLLTQKWHNLKQAGLKQMKATQSQTGEESHGDK